MRSPFEQPKPRQVEPGEFPAWDQALALLNRDLAATLPGERPLQLFALRSDDEAAGREWVHVALANGEWHGNALQPQSVADPLSALAAVADAAQETVTERLWRAWPLCGEHDLGMHPRASDGRLVWWCAGERPHGGPEHVRAAVGELDSVVRRARPNRRRRPDRKKRSGR
ncbi:hypothetical protein [Streptacidiphilus rugosus]|uniref:hypothetical protein n=1 Tax=Streptacidiphilus rugosus TaxID=405783 RepID=UPI00055AE3F7|nr:hypothetical protein [Streptacidiphilus rugosus]